DGGDTQTFSLGGADAGLLAIDGASGAVTLLAAADFESKSSYAFDVIVTDSGGLTATQAVMVAVNDVNEAPVFTSGTTGSVAENAALSTVIHTATASDGDAGDTKTFSLGGADAGLLAIDGASGAVTLTAPADFESKSSYAFDVIVTDSGGLAATQAVVVAVTDVNEAPVLTSGTSARVAENGDLSTVIYTATASDVDGGALRFLLGSGSDSVFFSMDIDTGEMRLRVPVDFETRSSYSFNITVADPFNVQASQPMTVIVEDRNDPPTVAAVPNATTAGYTEGSAATPINTGLVLADADDALLVGATVAISNGFVLGDQLGWSGVGAISGIYDEMTGVLTLSGSASVGDYQTLLRSVTFQSSSDDVTSSGTLATRSIGWRVTDANAVGSGTQTSSVATSTFPVTAVNDAPVIAALATTTYTEGGAALPVADGLILSDADDTEISSATVTIRSGLTNGDSLSFTGPYNILGAFQPDTGVLTLTGTASVAVYQDVLRSVTFASSSDYPTAIAATRTLAWMVTDANSDGVGAQSSLETTSTLNIVEVNALPSGTVSITGSVIQGGTLTAVSELVDTDGLGTISYQWLANGTPISGATTDSLLLTQAQVGQTITVAASYTDLRGTSESVTSAASSTVANVNDAPTGSVSISGTATQGETLTAVAALSDGDGLGTFSYQWLANGVPVATGSTYVLTAGQVGQTISVAVSYTDGFGSAESVTSSATSAVAAAVGKFMVGDGSGGGGGGGNQNTSGANGGAGGGDADTLTGSSMDDVIFGDGSGGGGGCKHFGTYNGGAGGGGGDILLGGAGNDILFGDGFGGGQGYFDNTNAGSGGAGGFGGGGGGGGAGGVNGGAVAQPGQAGGAGGIGAGGGGGGAPLTYTLSIGTAGAGGVGGGSVGGTPTQGTSTLAGTGGTGGSAVLGNAGGAGAVGGDSNASYPYYSGGGGGGGAGLDAGTGGAGGHGGSYNSGNSAAVGSAGDTSVVSLDDTSGTFYSYVSGQLSSIFTSTAGTLNGYGAGADTLNGGAGSDHLFGLGGNDIFVFELNEAGAADLDTIWDFDKNSEADVLKLTQGGAVIDTATRDALIAAQTASGADRTLVFSDGVDNQVTILVKNIGRNLTASDFCVGADPLVLDLDGNGIELTSASQQPVRFDMDADGRPDQTGWVGGGDGLLVLDRDHDGRINDIREVISEFSAPGVQSSLDALATLDQNQDLRIDFRDEAFGALQLQKADGSLSGLVAEGITALLLRAQQLAAPEDVAGNTLLALAGFERANGTSGVMAEVALTYTTGSAGSAGSVDSGGASAAGSNGALWNRAQEGVALLRGLADHVVPSDHPVWNPSVAGNVDSLAFHGDLSAYSPDMAVPVVAVHDHSHAQVSHF
ncbi:MAG: cadherin domain-containing protein, partial [Magnetococcales bacterium]|nr:cadherin domain-containing protein [Magnetococcales bacterium]